MISTSIRHTYFKVKRSPYIEELREFGTWLEKADYTPKVVRQHTIRLDRTLRGMAKELSATYTVAQLDAAFAGHNATPAKLVKYRSTQHHFQSFLVSQGRLTIPVIAERFTALCDRYYRELVEVRGFAHTTVSQHAATVADFLNRVRGPRQALRTLTQDDIDRYIAFKSTETSRQSLQHMIAVLRSFLSFLHDKGEIPARLDRIDTPRKYRDELLPRALDWPAVQALLRSIDRKGRTGERDYAILHLLAHYGLRPSEIQTLRLDSINWHDNTLRVQQRKTRSDLVLPLMGASVKILRRYLHRDRGDDTSKYAELFLRAHCPYGPLKKGAVGEIFARRAHRGGLGQREYSAYSLRHGFAMRLLTRGVGIKAIGDVLGHRNIESTCVYLRLDIQALRHVALPVPRLHREIGGRHA